MKHEYWKFSQNWYWRLTTANGEIIARLGRALLCCVLMAALIPLAAQAEIEEKDGWPAVKVIDMHTHVFNARDLPLTGILNALGAPRHVAVVVAEALLISMPEDDEPLQEMSLLEIERPTIQPLSEPQRNVLLDYVGRDRMEPLSLVAADLEVEPDVTLVAETIAKIGFPPEEHLGEEVAPQNLVNAAELGESLKGYIRFLGLITKAHGQIVASLMESYPAADLFVHHMMDMAVAYDDTPGVSFPEQIVAMQKLDAAYPGKLLHFSAFDPFRRAMALPLAKKAHMEHSAVGMKIYPPSGYRAADNEIHKFPSAPKRWRPDYFGKKRWKSRYAGWTEKELDAKLQEVFGWAAKDNIPLFTHCTPWGFQSVRGYGMMADPLFWSSVLKKAENKGLRLGLGHAGGDPYWLSNPDDDKANKERQPPGSQWQFGNQVVELCLTYPDVYCELGYLKGILDVRETPALVRRLQSIVNLPSKDGKWRFGDKIMYGTDWSMIHKESSYKDYLDGWDKVMKQLDDGKDAKTKGIWRQAFFARNAKKFLQLDKLAEDSRRFAPEQRKVMLPLSGAIK